MKKILVASMAAVVLVAFIGAIIFMLIFVSSVEAGNGILHNSSGKKVRVNCNGSGCSVIYYGKNGKRTGKKTSLGGRSNYLKLMKKLRTKGYK